MRLIKIFSLVIISLAVMGLSACDVTTPSRVNTGKIIIKNKMVVKTLDATRIDEAHVDAIASNFINTGNGQLTINMSYLTGKRARRVIAEKQGLSYKKAFKKSGDMNVSIVTIPVDNIKDAGKAIITYQALVAIPPKGCTPIVGNRGADTLKGSKAYKFGCNSRINLSKMVVNPTDLLGKDSKSKGDSRRLGATVEQYKSGTPNKRMGGFTASSIGTGGG